MKKFTILFILFNSAISLEAQFKTATLQASGLTCAMCTKAINNSLEELTFIKSVKADIKNSAFSIEFRENSLVDLDVLKKAVEDAGFSVANLSVTGNFKGLAIRNDGHAEIGGKIFHFLKVDDQVLNGEKQLKIVDRNFVTAKEFRKFSLATKMHCVQTGKTASCCTKQGITENTRIYHVTI